MLILMLMLAGSPARCVNDNIQLYKYYNNVEINKHLQHTAAAATSVKSVYQ